MKRFAYCIICTLFFAYFAFVSYADYLAPRGSQTYYYYTDDGSAYTGWLQLDRGDGYPSWHYFENSWMSIGRTVIDGVNYFFWEDLYADVHGNTPTIGTMAWGDPYIGIYDAEYATLEFAADKDGHLLHDCEADIDGKHYKFDSRCMPVIMDQSTLSIKGESKPNNLKKGSFFGITGTITSNYKITNVLAEIVGENGSPQYCGIRQYPNSTSYSLSGAVDNALEFNVLNSGNYLYRVWAQDESGTEKWLIWCNFTVSESQSSGDRIVQNAANRITYGYNGYEGHKGTDIGYSNDESKNIVYPHSPGVVVQVQKNWSPSMGYSGMNSYGNYVTIKHNNGKYTRYAHLQSVDVSTGQSVDRNTRLGVIGETGEAYGRHLHVELITNLNSNTRIDIAPYLNAKLP